MKIRNAFSCAVAVGTALIYQANTHAATVNLPASAAIPVNTASNPGFEVRVAQASTNVVVANSARRAQQQINGTLRDSANNVVANVAIPGTNSNGSFSVDTVSFEKDGFPVDLIGADGTVVWVSMSSGLFPGIPGLAE